MRPLLRLIAAILLPLLVPALITGALWALPGDPASIICPPGVCDGGEALAARWGLDQGPFNFYLNWIANAATGDFGRSWTLMAGSPVYDEMMSSIPWTAGLVVFALLPLVVGTVLAALGWLPRALDYVWQGIGIAPAVILALLVAAYVTITWGATFGDWRPTPRRCCSGPSCSAWRMVRSPGPCPGPARCSKRRSSSGTSRSRCSAARPSCRTPSRTCFRP
jgi:ABC-type dipeptide/oligopeptide/nickel transport system permease component